MPTSEIEQVLSNWIKQATEPPGHLADEQEPAAWVARHFLAWWQANGVGPGLSDAEIALRALQAELEQIGGWSNVRLGGAMHELLHLSAALAELRATLGCPENGHDRPESGSSFVPYQPALDAGISVEWDRQNGRRIELIKKKYSAGLTADERTELTTLQTTFAEYLATVFPEPSLDARRLDALEARLQTTEMGEK